MIKEKQSLFKRFIRSKAVIVCEVLVLLVICSALGREIVRRYQIQREISGLEEQATSLEQQRGELSNLISYFQSDSYKEEQARLKLGLQKPGEKVVTVLGESTEQTDDSSESVALAQADNSLTNPHRWWNYFFSIKKER